MADDSKQPVRWGHVMIGLSVIGVLVLPAAAIVWRGGEIGAKLDYVITQMVKLEVRLDKVEDKFYTKEQAREDWGNQRALNAAQNSRIQNVEDNKKWRYEK